MTLHRDHVAGGAFLVGGLFVLGVSGDLPFGTLASPGAGMLPTLVVGLMITFALVLIVGGHRSPLLATVAWSDLPHAVRVAIVAAAGIAAYTQLGFLATVPLLLFTLIFFVERRPFLPALAFSAGVTILVYVLFTRLLRAHLPQGLIGL